MKSATLWLLHSRLGLVVFLSVSPYLSQALQFHQPSETCTLPEVSFHSLTLHCSLTEWLHSSSQRCVKLYSYMWSIMYHLRLVSACWLQPCSHYHSCLHICCGPCGPESMWLIFKSTSVNTLSSTGPAQVRCNWFLVRLTNEEKVKCMIFPTVNVNLEYLMLTAGPTW